MNDSSPVETQSPAPVPPDDPGRHLTHVSPDTDESLPHLGVVGDTYTILVSGRDTAGRYTLIDMHVPPGGGPPPHRHDFEEMFTILDGEIEVTFRGVTTVAEGGRHDERARKRAARLSNNAGRPARLLCLCSPAGQEEFFSRRRPGRDPNRSPSRARRRRHRELHRQSRRARAEVPNRVAAPRTEAVKEEAGQLRGDDGGAPALDPGLTPEGLGRRAAEMPRPAIQLAGSQPTVRRARRTRDRHTFQRASVR